MVNLGKAERKAAKFVKDVKDLDMDDVRRQIAEHDEHASAE